MKINSVAEFEQRAKEEVAHYAYNYYDRIDNVSFHIGANEIYCVWICKTLQHFKGLFATPLDDGLYFEITYNGDKEEMYFDAYKKIENNVIK